MTKNDIWKRVEELNVASEAYYNSGSPIMSDAEFDSKLNELKEWEEATGIVFSNTPTQKVGSVVLKDIKKITHKTPMLSLEKCHSTEEIKKFAVEHNLVASIKLDGISCRLIYNDGDLIRAESRGDGTTGNDITEAVKQFKNIPLHINKEGTYVIDGEALIKLDDFENVNVDGEFKNSRNLAAGTLSSLDTSVVKSRKLSWYAWEVVEGYKEEVNSFYLNLIEANALGFDVVPMCDVSTYEFNNLQKIIDSMSKVAEEKFLPQDGVVFKFDDVKYGKSLGNTSHHFRNGIAWKAANNDVITTLKDIEFTMGKTGTLTPTAVFDTVWCDGSNVERASLHNISIMNETLGRPYKGQVIAIYKANLIIPQIRWGDKCDDSISYNDIITIPDKCPICGGGTKIVKENDSEVLICTNPDCKGKLLGKLTHAVSKNALDLDGLSEATIQKFINLGWLSSIKDIYHLSDYKTKMSVLEGFGTKSINKLMKSIEDSRNTTFDRFLYSLSIPMVGKTASKAISNECDGMIGKFIQIMLVNHAKYFKRISGIGDSLVKSLDDYFEKHYEEMWELSQEFKFSVQNTKKSGTSLSGMSFVITGSLNKIKNRDALKEKIESLGGKVAGSVSSKTTALINNDVESTSSKNKKAKSLGVPILSEDDFIEKYLGGDSN